MIKTKTHQGFKRALFLLLAIACFALFLSFLPDTFAQTQDLSQGGSGLKIPTDDVKISSAISDKSFADTILTMVNYFTGFLGFLATLALIYAGVLWILNGGNDELITKAKKIIMYALMGIILIILSQAIVRFIAFSNSGPAKPNSSLQCGNTVCNENQTCSVDENNQPICKDLPPWELRKSPDGRVIPNAAVKSGPSKPVVSSSLDKIDDWMRTMEQDLNIGDLSKKARAEVDKALVSGSLDQKIDRIKAMIKDPGQFGLTEADLKTLGGFLTALERLKLIRDELNEIQKTMPESEDILTAYQDSSEALDILLDDPSSSVKFIRFDNKYRALKKLINEFPFVQASIVALPGEGNVPFTVQLDGLDSVDPTGGTIASYKWSYIDAAGNEQVIGTDPVITYELTDPNTYAIRLQVATSQKDEGGYKTAADGFSVVRIKANPPSSQVKFRINGAQAQPVMTFTLKEAQAGLSFDPTGTTPALGRKIEQYEWFFGDRVSEVRQVPATVVHTYNEPGEYYVKLEVVDNLKVKDKKIVKLFIKSLASEIKITPNDGNVNTEFRLEGIKSRSDDGLITDYKWEIRDKDGRVVGESDEQTFLQSFDQPGNYQVSLVVTDITGSKDQDIDTIKVISRDPIANFTFSRPEVNHPNRIDFNAIHSYDPDEGDIIRYSWDFDGDGNFEINKQKEALVTHVYPKVGEYRVILQVEDSFGKRDLIEKKVSVESILSADIAVNKRAVKVGEPIKFRVENSNAVSYLWEFGDGETEGTDELQTEHVYNRTGQYVVKLNFFDADDNDNADTQRILVGASDEPLAVIYYDTNGREEKLIKDLCGPGLDGAVVSRVDRIRFNGKDSINTDGTSRLLGYNWSFPGGERSNDRDPLYKFDEISQEGKCFNVTLTVRDEVSGKVSGEDIAYFKVINEIPEITDFVIEHEGGVDSLMTPVKVKLRAVSPRDKDGAIKKYRWWYYQEGQENEKLGLHATSVPETSMTITSLGQPDVINRYYFVVESYDNDGGIYTSEERFESVSFLEIKNGPNLSPVADFTVDKTTISAGDSITFFSRSYDPQGDELPLDAFRWDFDGDGEFDDISSGPQVNRQYNTPGEYKARLRVVHRGLSSSATQLIVVEPTESLPQPGFTYQLKDNTVEFDGSYSRYDPTLEDTTLRFEWDFNTNEDFNGNGIKDDDVQSTEIKPTHTYNEKGRYKVRLKVIDSLGAEGIVVRDIDMNLTDQERRQNTFKSLKISAPQHPLTTLELEVVPDIMEKGMSADVKARVLNADNSAYKGRVYFEVIDGTGQFLPNPAEAKDSVATSIFNSIDSGRVRIRVTATDTFYGDLSEEAIIEVK